MRIARLDLDFFGHFAGQSLDFGPGESADFHVIHGPNEAGKTTLMEGFLRLLYGFPHREPYDFQHQRKNLRVSALLDLDGTQRRLIRRPTRSASLTDENDTPLPEAVLQAHLGGLGQEEYRKLLCLDDETIEKGGEEIAGSKGDIGRLLFSAAAGISDLSAVLDHTREEADAIYRKRASSTEVARIKKALADVTSEIREQDVSAGTYRRLKQAVDAASAEEEALRKVRDGLSVSREALRARIAALPLFDELNGLAAQIAPLAAYPDQLDISGEDLVRLLSDQRQAEADRARLDAEIGDLEDQKAALALNPDDLAVAQDLADLEDLRGRYKGAAQDLERRRQELAAIGDDMARAADDLDAGTGADPLGLVRSPAEIAALSEALDRMVAAERAVAQEQAEQEHLADRIAQAEDGLALRQVQASDQADIATLLDQFSADQLASNHAVARQALATAEENLQVALDALRQGTRRFERLPDCPVTGAEVSALAARWDRLADEHARATERRNELREGAEVSAVQTRQIMRTEGLVDDATAEAARAERDRLWKTHRATLTVDSAEAFKAAMDQAEAMADTRMAHAQALGQLRELDQAAAAQGARISHVGARIAEIEAEQADLSAELSALAGAMGLAKTTGPTALADWVTRHAEAARADADLLRLQARHGPVLAKATKLRDALAPMLGLEDPAFDQMIDAARRHAKTARDRQAAVTGAETALAELHAEARRRTRRLTEAEAEARSAAKAWQALVTDQFGTQVASETLARSLAPLATLRELDLRRLAVVRQVAAMEADQTAFAEAVAALPSRSSQSPSSDPLAEFDRLAARAATAKTTDQDRQRLEAQLADARHARDGAAQRLAEINTIVGTLGAGFNASIPTGTLPELRDAVRIADTTITARARMVELEARLRRDLGAPDMDAVRSLLDAARKPDLQAEAAILDNDLTRLDAQLSAAIEGRAYAERDLGAVTGDADIARLTERKATLELELEDAVMRYLELSLGHRLAEDAIRRYRDAHRSAMMAATEQAFAELTGGAYRTLRAETDGSDEILVAIDAQGRAKQASDMSKGTRFQLYLALRAAAYEQLTDQGIRLPFFCDDIFETFDEDRTRAACQVMARIGRAGQAIYLTHHAHVVDIAREVCGEDVRIHRLGA